MAKKTKRVARAPRRSFAQRMAEEQKKIRKQEDAARTEIIQRVTSAQRARELERLRVAAAKMSLDELASLAHYAEFRLAMDQAERGIKPNVPADLPRDLP